MLDRKGRKPGTRAYREHRNKLLRDWRKLAVRMAGCRGYAEWQRREVADACARMGVPIPRALHRYLSVRLNPGWSMGTFDGAALYIRSVKGVSNA